MIELIFVIVIIGILAAVAIPKLATNRTDAQAAICVHEAGQLLSEITGQYIKLGHNDFKTTPVQNMTNIQSLEEATAGQNSVIDDQVVDTSGVDYYCDGEAVVKFKAAVSGADYNLTITPATTFTSPAASNAAGQIKKNMTDGESSKTITI